MAKANYVHVNATWPDVLPVPTEQEAISGVRLLIRLAYRHAIEEGKLIPGTKPPRLKFKITSGNRYTWPRRGVWHVNPGGHHFKGWKDIVHDVSHWAGHKFWPNEGGHSPRHAYIERMMATHVVASGWLDGKLKRSEKVKAPTDIRADRYSRVVARIEAWERKKRRAETALKRLARQRAYYEQAMAA